MWNVLSVVISGFQLFTVALHNNRIGTVSVNSVGKPALIDSRREH